MKNGCILGTVIGIALGTQAGFDGHFNYIGYSSSFQGQDGDSIGEGKEVGISNGSIVTTTNAFLADFTDTRLERNIRNQFVPEPESMIVNDYSVNMTTEPEPGGTGTIAPTNNLILNIIPGNEPDNIIPLYFSRNTNVALNIEAYDSTNMMHEVGMGILIREGSGMTDSDLNGTCIRYTLGNGAYEIPGTGVVDRISMDRAVMTFDGNGTYTESVDEWSVSRITTEAGITAYDEETFVATLSGLSEAATNQSSTNGTYSLLPDGTLLISSDIGITTNQVSADGNMAASTLARVFDGFAGTFFTIVIKQPENMPTNAIDAVYFMAETGEEFERGSEFENINYNTLSLGRNYVYLRTDGTFTFRGDFWAVENSYTNLVTDFGGEGINLVAANVFSTVDNEKTIEFQSGTYTIAANGVVSLDFGNGDMGEAQLSENGEYLVFAFYDATEQEAERTMGFGIRRDPPPEPATPIEFESVTMTSTGLHITVTCPTNYAFEGLYSDNLIHGEWYSGGLFSSETGSFEFTDDELGDKGFYKATFAPW